MVLPQAEKRPFQYRAGWGAASEPPAAL